MKAFFVVLLVVTSAFAVSASAKTPRDKRQVLVLVPQPLPQQVLYVPVTPVEPQHFTCGSPAFTCQGACKSNQPGGIPAVKGELPYLAQIYSGSRQICGASIIDKNYVLTSASCVEPATPASVAALRIRLGDFKLNTREDGPYVERNVSVVYRHSEFVPQGKMPAVHDIALLKFSEPVTFSDYIRPICLDDGISRVDNGFTEGIVAGYGVLPYSSRPPTTDLYKVNVRVATPPECQNAYSAYGIQLTDSQICAGVGSPTIDPCVGDLGSPLIVNSGVNSYKQVGIFSFGFRCQGPPPAYVRISKYRTWIDQVRLRQN